VWGSKAKVYNAREPRCVKAKGLQSNQGNQVQRQGRKGKAQVCVRKAKGKGRLSKEGRWGKVWGWEGKAGMGRGKGKEHKGRRAEGGKAAKGYVWGNVGREGSQCNQGMAKGL